MIGKKSEYPLTTTAEFNCTAVARGAVILIGLMMKYGVVIRSDTRTVYVAAIDCVRDNVPDQ